MKTANLLKLEIFEEMKIFIIKLNASRLDNQPVLSRIMELKNQGIR